MIDVATDPGTGIPASSYWRAAHTVTERIEHVLGLRWDITTFAEVRQAVIHALQAESEEWE